MPAIDEEVREMQTRLKEVRGAAGYNQREASELFGVSLGTYRNWEQGRVVMNGEQLVRAAKAFDTTVSHILMTDDEADKSTMSGLKAFRRRSGLTQKEAADLFGLKYRTYQNYELGNTQPSIQTMRRFAQHFNCAVEDLFSFETEASDFNGRLLALSDSMSEAGRKALMATAESLADVFPK